MKPTIINQSSMLFVGFNFFGDPFQLSGYWTEENEIGRLWKRLMGYLETHPNHINHIKNKGVMYEIHVYNEEMAENGHFDVFIGVEVSQLTDVPIEVVGKVLPTTMYAVFTLHGEQIMADWSRTIYQEWLPNSPYQAGANFLIQRYDHRFKGVDQIADSVLEIYIPVATPQTNV